MRKTIKSILAFVMSAVMAVTVSGCKSETAIDEQQDDSIIAEKSADEMIQNDPEEYISMAAENTAKAVARGSFSDEYKLIEEALKDGTFTLEFEAEGIKFNGECYVNEKDSISSQLYTLTGSKGTSASIYAYADKNILKFGTQGNSGNHIYDVIYDTLEDKFASSIFAPGSGSSYAMDDSDYEAFLEYIKEIDSVIKGETTPDDPYAEIIKSYFDEHQPVTEENTDVTINGETVKGNVFSYSIPKDDIYSLIDKLVDKYMDEDAMTTLATTEGYTKDDVKKEIMSELDDFDNYSLELTYYVNSDSNQLMQVDMKLLLAEKPVEVSEEDSYYYNNKAAYEVSINAVMGADPANAEKQSFTLEASVDYYDENDYYEDSKIKISADVTHSENKTETVITYDEDGKSEEIATIVSEKNGDNYTVTLTVNVSGDSATIRIEGTAVSDENSIKITIDRIALVQGSAEVSYLPKAVITAKKGGEILALDAEKELLDITEEELDALAENIGEDFEAVLMEFAEDSAVGSSMLNYVKKSKMSSANANTKSVFTAVSTKLVQMDIDGEAVSSDVVTGVGSKITIDGKEYDMSDYLGEEFEGYYYIKIDPEKYYAEYAVWSVDPIPDEYKRQISRDEQESLADDDIFIGCYPFNY